MSRKKTTIIKEKTSPHMVKELDDAEPSLLELESEVQAEEIELEEEPQDVYQEEFHDATQLYLSEIGFLPLLSAEEELRISRSGARW